MKYRNPILQGDYSDPDVIRVGEDFYLIASSFTYLPGIPVLHSRDLVHWETVGYAVSHLPFARYNAPAHKCGAWAPSIRYHNGLFYVYVCLPDEGLFAFTAEDPAGEWQGHYVKDVCGWIDPCPFWDEDGQAYLLHGFANSRCGINNILYLHRMSPDGLRILDKGRLVYSGDDCGDTTVEGPKMYRRKGKYYILCPAGGVTGGYQLALRADSPYGPYERKIVLAQGNTPVNGPHQGGWVDDGRGGDYFIHFQDRGVYGRITHLQPVKWVDGWPVMGENGVPVPVGEVPFADSNLSLHPRMSDDFRGKMSLQWQWQANPNGAWYSRTAAGLRLYAAPADSLFHAGQFLSQLMQAEDFDLDARLALHGQTGDRAGLGMMGYRYGYCALEEGRLAVVSGQVREISRWERERVTERELAQASWSEETVYLRMAVRQGKYRFFFGKDEKALAPLGPEMDMACGGWVGARPGIFCLNALGRWGGCADFSFCHVRDKEGNTL